MEVTILMNRQNLHGIVPTELASRGVQHGTELYFEIDAAPEVVAFCDQQGIAIVGMEGFLLKEDGLYPLLDHIADFSAVRASTRAEFVSSCNRNAERVLAAWRGMPQLLVNFVFSV
jgi:hypothetical protein